MSFRSLNGLNNSIRSLNGLEGVGIDKISSGDAINVVDTTINNKTINVDISKQGATTSLADTDLLLLETSAGVIQKITGANIKSGTFSSNWTRSSGNIFPTITGDTIVSNDKIQSNTIADATYLDSLILQNTNSGTDVLTYSFQIKDAGSSTAPDFGGRLNFEVVYTKGGGSTTNVYEITYDGFMRILKRLEIANGFTANSGEDYDFPSTGGTLVCNTSGSITGSSPISVSTAGVVSTSFTLASLSATSPIAYNNTTGVISTAFTVSSTDNLSNKTFTDQTRFSDSLEVRYASATNVSGFVRFYEKADNTGTGRPYYTDLHTGGTTHTLSDNRNVYIPDATGTIVLDSTNLWTTGASGVIKPTNTSLTSIDIPNNCSIRNQTDTNQFIKFTQTTSTNETIELASNQVSIENLLVASVNSAYYLKFGNGILDSTFTQIHIPQDGFIMNDSDTTNDWIQFKDDIFNINYAFVDFKENVQLRNASDTTNDFISLRDNHFYINYAITEVIQGGKIANGSDPTNDYIQFNDNELYINYAVVDVAQSTIFQNSSNNNSAFTFESDRINMIGPLKITSDFGVHSTTRYPLEVDGYFTAPDTTGSALYYQNVPSLGGRAIAINGDVNMSAKFEFGLYVETGTELWVASDERIKKDITPFTGGLDLLRQLEVKTYKYIDGKGKEPKHNEIGFIAQEVKEIYPKAITLNHEYIPNVYKQITCEWSDFEDKFKMKSVDLTSVYNVDYKFYCWNEGDKIETKITSIGNSDNTFTFNKKWENVFCIGNKVDDFNTLDKSSLFIINFSATKELDNIVKQQQIEINNLKSQLSDILDILSKNNIS